MLTQTIARRLRLLENAKNGRENLEYGKELIAAAKETDLRQYGGNLDKSIDHCILKYNSGLTSCEKAEIKQDVWKARVLNLVDPEEYFLYGFRDLNETERYSFVGNREKESLCAIINENGVSKIFMDKWKTYQRFGNFYGRKMIHISSEAEKNVFYDFCQRYNRVFVKKANGSQGKGIFVIDRFSDYDGAWNEITKMLREGGVVAEESILQGNAMALFNSSTVNTARIATFRFRGKKEIMFSFVIFGRMGSVVNNGGMGGIIVSTSLDTGICITDGRDENGGIFVEHPDSHQSIKGYVIPDWNGAVSLAQELSDVIPEQLYVGWDLAYTNNGWIMVEGNSWSQFIGPQLSLRTGLREMVERTFYDYIREIIQ